MATFRASLNISSPDVVSSDISLNAALTDTIDSGYIMKVKVANTDGNPLSTPPPTTLYKVNDKTESAYLFVRNLGDEKEKYIYLMTRTSAEVFGKIPGGGFALVPVKVDETIYAYATEQNQVIEYAVFGTDAASTGFV